MTSQNDLRPTRSTAVNDMIAHRADCETSEARTIACCMPPPTWDAQAELAALTASRPRSQPPAWRDWLTRIAHPRRTKP